MAAEKASIQGVQSVKAQLESARVDYEAAKRSGDYSKMSELQYGIIPNLEKKITKLITMRLANPLTK